MGFLRLGPLAVWNTKKDGLKASAPGLKTRKPRTTARKAVKTRKPARRR